MSRHAGEPRWHRRQRLLILAPPVRRPTWRARTRGCARAQRARCGRGTPRSPAPLRSHTDRTAVIALLCVNNSNAAGVSKLASTVTIYNEILRRRPDLLEVLCQDYWRTRVEGEVGGNVFAMPVFGIHHGKLTS